MSYQKPHSLRKGKTKQNEKKMDWVPANQRHVQPRTRWDDQYRFITQHSLESHDFENSLGDFLNW